jgi:hypothetical protein
MYYVIFSSDVELKGRGQRRIEKTIAVVVEYMFCDCPKGGLSLSFIVIVKPAVTSIKQSFFFLSCHRKVHIN